MKFNSCFSLKYFVFKRICFLFCNKQWFLIFIHTIVWHCQDWKLGDGAVSSFHAASSFIDGGQVRVHISRISTTTRNFFSRSRDLNARKHMNISHFLLSKSTGVSGTRKMSANERKSMLIIFASGAFISGQYKFLKYFQTSRRASA